MKRGKEIVVVSHCVLNSNAKVEGLSEYSGVLSEVVDIIVQRGAGIIQLPCPEMFIYGIKRWGHVKEQFDTPHFRNQCKELINPIVQQLVNYKNNGYDIIGLIGIDGSPSCGVNKTCSGDWGGEFMENGGMSYKAMEKIQNFKFADGPGVLMEEIKEEFHKNGIDIPFMAIDEMDTGRNIAQIREFFESK